MAKDTNEILTQTSTRKSSNFYGPEGQPISEQEHAKLLKAGILKGTQHFTKDGTIANTRQWDFFDKKNNSAETEAVETIQIDAEGDLPFYLQPDYYTKGAEKAAAEKIEEIREKVSEERQQAKKSDFKDHGDLSVDQFKALQMFGDIPKDTKFADYVEQRKALLENKDLKGDDQIIPSNGGMPDKTKTDAEKAAVVASIREKIANGELGQFSDEAAPSDHEFEGTGESTLHSAAGLDKQEDDSIEGKLKRIRNALGSNEDTLEGGEENDIIDDDLATDLEAELDDIVGENHTLKSNEGMSIANDGMSIAQDSSDSKRTPGYNVLANPEKLNSLPDAETLLLDARKYDSNKDKEFYDESMRTSNTEQTAIFNEPAVIKFTPPKGYGPLIRPVQVDSDLPAKDFFSKLRMLTPIGLGILSALPTLAAKVACTTALTPLVPWAPLAVGIVSASYNLRKDYEANKDENLTTWQNVKQLGNRKSLANAFGAGLVGATSSFVGILAVDAIADYFLPEAFCAATETVMADPAPLTEAPTPEVAPEPEVVPEPVIGLTADQIVDTTMLLDGAQNDLAFAETLIENATNHGADPASIELLQAKVDAGFDFIDTATSADAVALFNTGLESAMDAASEGGTDVTPEEYAQILTDFINTLNEGQFITDVPGPQDIATNLDVASLTQQGQQLRAAIV
jgi:hypothetical protein